MNFYYFDTLKVVNRLSEEKRKEYEDFLNDIDARETALDELSEKAIRKARKVRSVIWSVLIFTQLALLILGILFDGGAFADSKWSLLVFMIFFPLYTICILLRKEMEAFFIFRMVKKENVRVFTQEDEDLYNLYDTVMDLEDYLEEFEDTDKYQCLGRRIFVSTDSQIVHISNCYEDKNGCVAVAEMHLLVKQVAYNSSIDCLTYDASEQKLTLPVRTDGNVAGKKILTGEEEE